jgi:hypothetical protein
LPTPFLHLLSLRIDPEFRYHPDRLPLLLPLLLRPKIPSSAGLETYSLLLPLRHLYLQTELRSQLMMTTLLLLLLGITLGLGQMPQMNGFSKSSNPMVDDKIHL